MAKRPHAMKNSITHIIAVAATFLTIGQAMAAEPVKVNSTSVKALERALDRELNKHLAYPVLEKSNMTGDVYVSFLVNKEGRIEVIECNSTNEKLRQYVIKKLARIDIGENPNGIWKTTHMRISFHPERT
jgi:hypothetical protein